MHFLFAYVLLTHTGSEHLPPLCGKNGEVQLRNIHFSTTGTEQLHTAPAQCSMIPHQIYILCIYLKR